LCSFIKFFICIVVLYVAHYEFLSLRENHAFIYAPVGLMKITWAS
jgi:hypothetical protein